MIVARPLRSAEGMGAATVGPGHRNTTCTGVRGPEAPKGKGRRRERDRERAELLARDRDPVRRTGYMQSTAPGVDPEDRDLHVLDEQSWMVDPMLGTSQAVFCVEKRISNNQFCVPQCVLQTCTQLGISPT